MSNKQNQTNLNNKAFFREWLERLQQESWQLELIISGFALYGIYSSKGALVDLSHYSSEHSGGMILGMVVVLLKMGWRIFFINLLIHVILRSLWIGAIGLRYVSAEIEYDQLRYSELFTEYLRRKVGDYDDFIERLERICSVLFSYTFLLFLLFMSMLIFILGFTIPFYIQEWLGYEFGEDNETLIIVWVLPYFFFGLVVFIDFITLGGLKRIQDKTFSKIYMPIYRFYSTITLSFLYRPLLYNFIDNNYTRRLFYLSIPYMFLIASGHRMFSENNNPHIPLKAVKNGLYIDESYYDDLYEKKLRYLNEEEEKEFKHLRGVRLSAFDMTQSYNSIFIKPCGCYDKLLENRHGITPIYKDGWQFTLFNKGSQNKIAVDSIKNVLSIQWQKKYDLVGGQYKSIRDSIRKKLVDSSYLDLAIIKRDSLLERRIQIDRQKREVLRTYDLDKEKLILETIQSFVDISIDGVDLKDKIQCYFANHPNHGEQGLRCNFSIDSLSPGMHEMTIKRITKYNVDQDTVTRSTYVLPFIKQF